MPQLAQVNSNPGDSSSANCIELSTVRTCEGKSYETTQRVDFDELLIRRGGLLEAALLSVAQPMQRNHFYVVLTVLKALRSDSKARLILSTPVGKLDIEDIQLLFHLADEALREASHGGVNASQRFRSMIRGTQHPLANGQLISSSVPLFRSEVCRINPGGHRSLISEQTDKGVEEAEFQQPISTLRSKDNAELMSKARKHLRLRNQRIENACWKEINEWLEWQRLLCQLKSTPLPDDVAKHIHIYGMRDSYLQRRGLGFLNSLPIEMHLQALLHLIEHRQLFRWDEYHGWREEPAVQNGFKRPLELYEHYPQIKKYSLQPRKIHSALLADYYMPRRVVLCARHLYQLELSWNVSTACNLSRDAVSPIAFPDEEWRKAMAFQLTPIKGKTDQESSKRIDQANSKLPDLTKILLQNNENIDRFWRRSSDSLFVSWTVQGEMDRFQTTAAEHQGFCTEHNLSLFTFEQLRDQAAVTKYMAADLDVNAVVAVLEHLGYGSAHAYLDQIICQIIADANMHEFMQRLGASIVWAIEGPDGVEKRGMKPENVDETLLYPVYEMRLGHSSEVPVCDTWLEDQGTKIVIDFDRMEHTVRQRLYYRAEWLRLFNDNPARFKAIHLPRMLFNAALYWYIRDSSYGKLLAEIEAHLA